MGSLAQEGEITLETAVALARAARVPDARRLLERVAFAPHASAKSLYAKGLLDQVSTGKPVDHVPGEIPEIYEKAATRR